MWRRLYAVDERHCPGVSGFLTDCGYIIDRAGQVACTADTDQSCAIRNNLVENIKFELECFLVERQPTNLELKISGQQHPWPDVGVMVHSGQYDLVTFT